MTGCSGEYAETSQSREVRIALRAFDAVSAHAFHICHACCSRRRYYNVLTANGGLSPLNRTLDFLRNVRNILSVQRLSRDCSALLNLLISILIVRPLEKDIARHDICLWVFFIYTVLDGSWCVPVIKLKRLGAEVFFLHSNNKTRVVSFNRLFPLDAVGWEYIQQFHKAATVSFVCYFVHFCSTNISSCERTWVNSFANRKNGKRINLRAVVTFDNLIYAMVVRARIPFDVELAEINNEHSGSAHQPAIYESDAEWQLK